MIPQSRVTQSAESVPAQLCQDAIITPPSSQGVLLGSTQGVIPFSTTGVMLGATPVSTQGVVTDSTQSILKVFHWLLTHNVRGLLMFQQCQWSRQSIHLLPESIRPNYILIRQSWLRPSQRHPGRRAYRQSLKQVYSVLLTLALHLIFPTELRYLVLYTEYPFSKGSSPATISSQLSAVAYLHKLANVSDPTQRSL